MYKSALIILSGNLRILEGIKFILLYLLMHRLLTRDPSHLKSRINTVMLFYTGHLKNIIMPLINSHGRTFLTTEQKIFLPMILLLLLMTRQLN